MLISGTWRGGQGSEIHSFINRLPRNLCLSYKSCSIQWGELLSTIPGKEEAFPCSSNVFLWCNFIVEYCYICSEVRFQSQKIAMPEPYLDDMLQMLCLSQWMRVQKEWHLLTRPEKLEACQYIYTFALIHQVEDELVWFCLRVAFYQEEIS